jgi:hypothetical protein
MATAEKTKEQQKQPTLQQDDDYSDYSDEDYETDDYEVSGDEAEAEDPKAQQKRRQRQQQQRNRQPDAVEEADDEDYSDEDDFYSDDYDDDDDYDNQVASGKAMQPYQPAGGNQSLVQNGSMNVIPQQKQESSLDDEEGMKLKLELNLEIEVELKAHIHGDLTLALMYVSPLLPRDIPFIRSIRTGVDARCSA